MADEQHCAPLLRHVAHLAQALALELSVADCQHFVHHQNLRLQMGSHGKRQAQVHARRVALDRRVNELLHFGKIDNLIKFSVNIRGFHAQDGAVQVDILAPG